MDRDEVVAGSSTYFVGRISQLLLYDYKLSDPEVAQAYNQEVPNTPRPSVLDQEKTTMLYFTVDYGSHLQCLSDRKCDIFDGK